MQEAADEMVIDHARRLHIRVANRGTHKRKAAALQVLAHGIRLFGARGQVFYAPAAVADCSVVGKLPDVFVETSEFFLDLKEGFGIFYGTVDFKAVSYNADIFKKFFYLAPVVFGDFLIVEIVEGFAEILSLMQNRAPA